MRVWELFHTPAGKPRVVAPALAMLVVSAAIAMLALHLVGKARPDAGVARSLLETGKAAAAEELDAAILRRAPTVPNVLAFAQAHARAKAAVKKHEAHARPFFGSTPDPTPRPAMSDEQVVALLAPLPPDVQLLGRFALGFGGRDEVEAAAKRDPPMPFANHVLARAALAEDDEIAAAEYFWREGTAFPERRGDLDASLRCLVAASAWEALHDRLETPGVARAVSPDVRYELAVHERDWRGALRVLPGMYRERFQLRFLWLAAVAALAWGFFCARLGRVGERPRVRAPLYLAAFVLGVLSVGPTLALIAIEQAKLHLVETGDVPRDILFFVFGVGLREEASKLLLFAPLLPLLRRWGDKLDVLVCGAFVGLGFAAEENLGYLAGDDLRTGLGRFLTANFLHMAMTGILASALDDFVRDRERYAQDFTRATLMVVGLHGAYDFLISHDEMGGGFAAMVVFVVLAKLFLDTVESARRRADRGITPMHAFALALAVVTGVSFAHAVDTVGVAQGIGVMAEGVLGEAMMVIVFARFLARM